MAYVTIHRMEGDPDDLLRQKQEKFDPTVKEFAGQHGAFFSVTAKTAQGLVVVNVWESAEAAVGFTQLPQIQQAQRESGLPMPSSFERYPDAQLDEYQR
jgi:quinol monooxygenase YgiN